MATVDQLEIISTDGVVEIYDLDPAKGVTSIGRHPDNDIILEGPGISLFHAMLDHRQKPYHFLLLSHDASTSLAGRLLPAHTSSLVQNGDTIQLNGYTLILVEAEGPVVTPGRPPAVPITTRATSMPQSAASLITLPPDHADEVILTELSGRAWIVNVEQTVMFQVTLINGGDIVAMFAISVEGLDESWVVVSPPYVNLNENERATITIALSAPRLPTSRAGLHHFAVIVTSPNHPRRYSQRGATLVINPYPNFAVSELDSGGTVGQGQAYSLGRHIGMILNLPQTQIAPHQSVKGSVTVLNLGNHPNAQFDLELEGLASDYYEIEPGPLLSSGAEKEVSFALYHRGTKPLAGIYQINIRAVALNAYPTEQVIVSQTVRFLPSYEHKLTLPKLPLEYPLREAFAIYWKRLAIFLAVVLINLILLGFAVLAIYNLFIFFGVVIFFIAVFCFWLLRERRLQQERQKELDQIKMILEMELSAEEMRILEISISRKMKERLRWERLIGWFLRLLPREFRELLPRKFRVDESYSGSDSLTDQAH